PMEAWGHHTRSENSGAWGEDCTFFWNSTAQQPAAVRPLILRFSLARFLRAENGTVFYGPQTRPDPRPTRHDRQSTAAQLGQIRHQSLANADRALSLR